ncbi:FecR domain-containing protein [candidate division KSB1 bacterium]|nr:FecR domain-containing protein [candidate division KSB1 bacterium]
MKKNSVLIVSVLSAAMVLAFIAATSLPDDTPFIIHTVKKGETVSLLCIEIYGYYNKGLGTAFMKDNPAVKNINTIYVAQKLKFRKPVSEADKALAKEDTVFYKKVDATQGVVTYVEGRAFIKKQGGSAFQKLAPNSEVYPGDVIKTSKNGRVELIINRESVVRLKENTELTIEAFRDMEKKEGKTALNFSIGSLWSKIKQFKDKISRFELEMPTAIAGVHGTIYQTTVNSDSSAEVKVYDGEVEVSGKKRETEKKPVKPKIMTKPFEVSGPRQVTMEEWTQIVRAMQSIRIDRDGVPSDPAGFERAPDDDWERWNEERDKRIAEMFSEN